MSFSQRQKILKCLWSKNFELQKCGHTEKSNYGLNLSIILVFLIIYGVGKLQCDRSNQRKVPIVLQIKDKFQNMKLGHHTNINKISFKNIIKSTLIGSRISHHLPLSHFTSIILYTWSKIRIVAY